TPPNQPFSMVLGCLGNPGRINEMSKADATFKPLERYLHRGSHRDEVNIAHVDWGQFDLNYYFAKLEMLFDRAGHQDHFKMKMGLVEVEETDGDD
ncbi:hypothetical protein ACULL4_01340, partial [Xanthomonas arboricola pv. corylina]